MICIQDLDINTFENLRSKMQLMSWIITKAIEQHLSVVPLVNQHFANKGFRALYLIYRS